MLILRALVGCFPLAGKNSPNFAQYQYPYIEGLQSPERSATTLSKDTNMTNSNANSQDKHVNPIDEFFARDQENEISTQESVQHEVFDVNADDIAHPPHETSQEHSLDDTHETLTPDLLETDALDEAAENEVRINEQE